MKIAFMTSGTILSSLSYRALSLAKELHKKGHDVAIIAPRFDKYSHFIDEKIINIEGVTILRPMQLKTFSFEIGLMPYIFSSFLMLLKHKPDIIHVSKPNPLTLPALLFRFIAKVPVVFDIDDLDSEVMIIEKNPFLKIKLVQISEKLFTRFSDYITVASTFLYKIYRDKNQIAVISNGAEFTNRYRSNKSIKKSRIVFIGNMNRKNILEPLFLALKKLEQENIKPQSIIIGSGAYLTYFKKLTRKLKLSTVTFLGHVPQNEIQKALRIGDIGYCYMPNERTIQACSSMKIFQYMQYGVVPLVSRVGDLPMYVFQGKAGYIAKHTNNDDLILTIKKALAEKDERLKKMEYVKKYCANKFSWQSLAAKMEKIYIQLLVK